MPTSGEEPTKLFAGSMLDQAELRVIRGTYQGTTVGLSAGTVVIGRSSDCELSLKGAQGVSRRHCKVQYLGNRFVIIDLESRNGTIVNGQSVERKVLEKGDRIEVGDETIEFVVESLNDVRDVPLQDGAIEDQPTALLNQATGAFAKPRQEHTGGRAPPAPPTASLDDEAPLPETLPPQQARPMPAAGPAFDGPPRVPAQPELSSPYVHQARAPASRAPLILGLLTLLVVVGGGFLVYDLGFRKPATTVDANANANAVIDAGTAAVAVATVDAGTATVAVATVDAGVVAAAVDAGAVTGAVAIIDTPDAGTAIAAAIIDAGTATVAVAATVDAGAAAPAIPPDAPARVLRANVAGKATKVLVKEGDKVKVGDVLVVVAADSPNLMRKIDALRREEREFAEAAKSDPSSRGDLAAVRAELRKAESKLTPRNQTADSDGTVVEVVVKVGDTVRDGAPIFKLAP